ncbi:nicotinamide riboside transporter PnuC [Aquirufa salirivi]|uniref:Nicotinamide riboside transporter PnuC n=1 Tax=Aquirufa salirivi TaxID=3104729 RepID=A0ABW8RUQ3_9BACT
MIIQWIQNNIWEFSGIICSLLGVYFSIKQQLAAWIWNILGSILFGILFYHQGLYSDMELQGFFIVMGIYGFYQWKKEDSHWKAERSSKQLLMLGITLAISYGLVVGFLHSRLTNWVSFAYLDATLTGLSIFGTWLAINKKIENWILWIFIDIIYVLMYVQKALWGTSLLYILFIFLAIRGLSQWKKSLRS